LMWKRRLSDNEGLLLTPCNSLHTMFMRFPIDVLFLDNDFTVVKTIENLKPWRVTSICKNSCQVVELKAGSVDDLVINVGDKLSVVQI